MIRLLAALTLSAAAAAGAAPGADWANVTRLATGSEVRITLANGKTVRGFLQKASADSLMLNAQTSQETLSRDEVKRVHLKRPGHRGRNTLIGLGLGSAGGLTAGAIRDRNDNWFPNLGKAILTPVGAVIGTVVGVAIPTGGWREIYRAP